jgi:hypothetical protein
MPQVADEPLENVTFKASIADMAWLREHTRSRHGYSELIRKLIKQYRRRAEAELEGLDTGS